ncbi:DNA endonuclease RBBP8-like [Frankliniella occidentalis]|uniref:DNA endonuclease RBBP8-like n=1 Tax=Frankliniella occidentalis TaxID=133901 RepID=A0A9C6X2C6_FRAOC|nr:DNA endonuclease RBBP8-like [Frankliniella occidentalis]
MKDLLLGCDTSTASANTETDIVETTASASPIFKSNPRVRRCLNFDLPAAAEGSKKPELSSNQPNPLAAELKPKLLCSSDQNTMKSLAGENKVQWLSSLNLKRGTAAIPNELSSYNVKCKAAEVKPIKCSKSNDKPKSAEVNKPLWSNSQTKSNAAEAKQMKRSSSYDRLPEKENPPYAFKGKTVRGNKRKAFPGHACTDCEGYYECAGVQGDINKVSRHRAQHPPVRSPKGFWSLDFPSTQELRERQSALPSPEKEWRF